MTPASRWLASALICAVSLIVFETMCVIENARTGPTHADDAYFANVAENFTSGTGYGTTIQPYRSVYRFVPFDPQAAIGPLPVLLGAALIAGFGNLAWVPGLANIALQALFLALTLVVLYRQRPEAAAMFSLLFLLMISATAPFDCALWYSLLGEGTVAALMTLTTAIVWCRDVSGDARGNRAFLYVVGLLCGLSVSTKLLALWFVVPVLVFVGPLSTQEMTRRGMIARTKATVILVIGFATPLVAFALYWLLEQGSIGYIDGIREWIAFVGRHSQNLTQYAGFYHQISSRSAELRGHFGLSGWLYIGLGLAGFGMLLVSRRRLTARILGAALCIQWTWWFVFSPGWPRYAYYGTVLVYLALCFGVISSYLEDHHRPALIGGLVSSLTVVVVAASQIGFHPKDVAERGLAPQPTPRLEEALAVARLLEERGGGRLMYTQGWATAAAQEYLLPGTGHFTTIRDPRFEADSTALIVLDRRLMDETDQTLAKLLEGRCTGRLHEGPNFLVASCVPD